MVKAILIDLDGTLVDTTPALYQVYLKFLKRYGHEGTEKEFESLIGPSIEEIVRILKKKYELKESAEELATMYVTLIMLQGFEGTKLFPGVKEFIDGAKKDGSKLAVVTSGTHDLVKTCLDPLGVFKAFDLVVTSQDVKQSKPHPDIYKEALERLKIEPDEAIAIEDSEAGAQAAKNAGLKVFIITHGKEKPIELDGCQMIENWDKMKRCLKSS